VSFGLSALTRTAGLALLLLPLLLIALDGRLRLGAVAKRSAAVTGVAAMLMLGGMWANMLRHGHVEIGSNSGVSLLGKGMLLLQPGPHGNLVLDDMAPRAAQARAAVDAAPGTAASLRAQAQANEALRWRGFFEKAGTVWPGVTLEPRRETNMVSGQVARAIIAEQPLAYLRLVARDWLALVIYPHLWPVAGTENARLAPFDDCDIRPLECWAHVRLDIPRPYALSMLAVSAAGHAARLVLVLGWGLNALRRRLAAPERVMFSAALVAQATLRATALFEAGLWRYALPAHVIHIALAVWLYVKVQEAFSRAVARAPARAMG
jgi:hypothetical protein